MAVPYFGVDREFAHNRDAILSVVEDVLASGQSLQGPAVTAFEATLTKLSGRRHAVAVNSCTDALYFALLAAGVGAGDEVIVPDFSFLASATGILRAGATPVFADVDDTCNLDLDRAGALVTARTRAVIYVHLYGRMGDPAAIEAFGAAHGIAVIEDAAQAVGGAYGARPAGSVGLASCVSFDPTKPVSAPGSGGVVLTDDAAVADRARRLRYHGKSADGQFVELGFNSQMPTVTAAVLGVKLARAAEWMARRQDIAARYNEGLDGFGVAVPDTPAEIDHVFHKYVVRVPERDRVRTAATGAGVQTMVHYAQPLHATPNLTSGRVPDDGNPVASRLSAEVLSLPIHPYLDDAEVDTVIDVVRTAVKGVQ